MPATEMPTYPASSTSDEVFNLFHNECSDYRNCPWCDAPWVKDPPPRTSSSQQHSDDCAYMKWLQS